jgi:hypothetical protein
MKTLALYLFALLISFKALALESPQNSNGYFQQQQSKASDPVVNVQDSRKIILAQANSSSSAREKVAAERQDGLINEIIISSLFILIYSAYWLQIMYRSNKIREQHNLCNVLEGNNITGRKAVKQR